MLKNTFVRYFVIGISGAVLDFSIFALFYNIVGVGEVIANLIGSFFGFNNNFFLNAHFNFKAKDKFLVRYFTYFMICLFGMIVTSVFLYVTVSVLGFDPYISKFFAMAGIFVLQYALNKKITFK